MKAKEKLNKLEGKSFAKTVSFISDRNHLFKQQLWAPKIYKDQGNYDDQIIILRKILKVDNFDLTFKT